MSESIAYMTDLLPVFVYGSLRPDGNGANGMMEGGKVAGPWRAVMRGKLYYHECGAYPVLDVEEYDLTKGDVYLMDTQSPEFDWVWQMEVRAGYEPVTRTAFVRQSNGVLARADCLVFAWTHPHRGEWVETGDWLTADAVQPWPVGVR